MTEKYRKTLSKGYPYILIGLSALILSIKCFYSFCWSDETFYISTCHRFFTGDSVFLHEWFPTQLSSLILLPFYLAFMQITGSNTGIVLFFRVLYVMMSLACSLATFRILKQHVNDFTASVCSLMVLYYTHLNIATLSYYTISVQFTFISLLLVYHYYRSNDEKQLVTAGILFAVSVLALPTLSIAYILAMTVIGIILFLSHFTGLLKGKEESIKNARLPEIVKYTFIGICIPALVFLIFMLSNVSISDFIRGIPYVLTDEEHGTSFIYPLKKFFIGINEVYGYGAYSAYLLIAVSFILSFFPSYKSSRFRLMIFIADVVLFADLFVCSAGHTGYINTALSLFALPLFFMLDKRDLRLFFTLITGGLILALTYSYSSNGYLYVLSMGHFITAVGGIIVIDEYLRQLKPVNTAYAVTCTAVICSCLLQTMELRLVNIYRDAPVQMLNFRINAGPAKGLYTTADHYVAYNVVYSTLKNYCQSSNLNDPRKYPNSMELDSKSTGNIFITKLLPWGYMCTDLTVGSPTTWRTAFNSERLEPYYDMNPGRYPDMILVMNEEYGSYLTCGDVEADPAPNENEIGGFLLDYINENSYEKTSVPCGILYKRK